MFQELFIAFDSDELIGQLTVYISNCFIVSISNSYCNTLTTMFMDGLSLDSQFHMHQRFILILYIDVCFLNSVMVVKPNYETHYNFQKHIRTSTRPYPSPGYAI